MGPEIVVPMGFFAMVVMLAVGLPLVKALSRHWERGSSPPLGLTNADTRLERIEQTVDSMAVEIERISEGQRFVTKLLAESAASRAALPHGRDKPT